MAENDASTQKSGNEVPKNGNMSKNKQGLKLENLKKSEDEEPTVTKATIIIPPDGGFAWVVMVRNCKFLRPWSMPKVNFLYLLACKFLLQLSSRWYSLFIRHVH